MKPMLEQYFSTALHFCLPEHLRECLHSVKLLLYVFADAIVDSHWIATHITSIYEIFYSVASSE